MDMLKILAVDFIVGAVLITIGVIWVKWMVRKVSHPSFPKYLLKLAAALNGDGFDAEELRFLYSDSIKGEGLRKVKNITLEMVRQFAEKKGNTKEFREHSINVLKTLISKNNE
jgi:hypothetical protein